MEEAENSVPGGTEAAGIEGTGPSVPLCLKDLCNTWGQDRKAEGLGVGDGWLWPMSHG